MKFHLTVEGEVNAENKELIDALMGNAGSVTVKKPRKVKAAASEDEDEEKEEKVEKATKKKKVTKESFTEFILEQLGENPGAKTGFEKLLKKNGVEKISEMDDDEVPELFEKSKAYFESVAD